MSVKIRMRKTGAKNKPCFRIVVTDTKFQRDGRFIENIGYYDPRHNDEKIDLERAQYWIGQGAQPSETVADIILRAKGERKPPYQPKPQKTAPAAKKVEGVEEKPAVQAQA